MSRAHLITGATGFVGGAITLELLRRTESTLYCLTRPRKSDENIQARLESSLFTAARAYGMDHLMTDIPRRCVAIAGDILKPRGSVWQSLRVDEIWHAAASLKYEDEYRDEVWAHNVDGTWNILDLAHTVQAEVFNHVSTAYVAGSRQGMILEEPAHADTPVNNCYEASKIEAEKQVTTTDIYSRILRPSIVIGHSQTLAATSFTGFYGSIRNLANLGRMATRYPELDPQRRSVMLRVAPDTPVNFVPIDSVASDAVALSLADTSAPSGRVYHLTNDYQPQAGALIRLLFKLLRYREPLFVQHREQLTKLDRLLDDKLRFYISYWRNAKTFSRQHTDAVIGTNRGAWRLDETELARHIQWYLALLASGPDSKPGARRPIQRSLDQTLLPDPVHQAA